MTSREAFFKTIRREIEGYIPFEFKLCPYLLQKFYEKTGLRDYQNYYEMPYRFVAAVPKKRDIRYEQYYSDLEGNITFDEWGVARKRGEKEHFSRMLHPMESFETIEEMENYPYPDAIKDYDWTSFQEKVLRIKQNDLIAVAAMGRTIFELAWGLRGMENFMIDLMSNAKSACFIMDKILEIRCIMAKKYIENNVDVLQLGDDVGTQKDMMMSPMIWREYLKPRLKKVIDTARAINPDILIDYHSDGNIQKIIPDLIEIGVDILNPIQPECMDPVEIKECYGDRLSFRGALGTQTTMPFGTPDEVVRVCNELIEKVGKGGGFILAPSHILEPEVTWENIEALINTVKNHNAKVDYISVR